MARALAPRCRAVLAACALALLAGLAGAEALPGKLPLRRDAEAGLDGGAWMPSVLLLGLAVAAGGYAFWRRTAGAQGRTAARRGEATLTRLSSQALTPHASVHTVQWNGEEFLLACTQQQVTLLARRGTPAEGGTP